MDYNIQAAADDAVAAQTHGEKFDESKAHKMKTGSYGLMPKVTRHFAWGKDETVIQIHSVGRFKTFRVNAPEKDGSKE